MAETQDSEPSHDDYSPWHTWKVGGELAIIRDEQPNLRAFPARTAAPASIETSCALFFRAILIATNL
jgi:hypothetical protein